MRPNLSMFLKAVGVLKSLFICVKDPEAVDAVILKMGFRKLSGLTVFQEFFIASSAAFRNLIIWALVAFRISNMIAPAVFSQISRN
jgi:hypothetical protein